jgi:flagellar M-ring protein FliF
VENVKEFFSKFGSQFSANWSSISTAKKLMAIGALSVVTIGISALLMMGDASPHEYIFTNLSDHDRGAIDDFFRRNNVEDYVIDKKGVRVRAERVRELRMKLIQEGIPSSGVVGYEAFDKQDFMGKTDFEQRILKLRAIQGELQRTITMIEGVNSARIHVVTPRKSLFVEDQKPTTAAVYLKTRRGAELSRKQIKGISNLIARSVEGLATKNITIIDSSGKVLTEDEPDDFASVITQQRLKYKRSIEKMYEERVRAIVGRVVGPDRVEVRVNTEVDFTQEQQTISDIDPDRVVPVSKTSTGSKLSGTGLNPTGIPGSKSNVPGEQEALSLSQSSTSNTTDAETINYEISKTIRKKTLPVGDIVKISVAVLVDGKQDYPLDGSRPVFEERSKEEMKQIADLVKSSVGFKDKRGDDITVRNMMFQLDPLQIENIKEEKKETREYIATLAISASVALALVLFFSFIVRPYFRWLSYDPERKKSQQVVEEFKPDLDLGALQNVQVKEDVPFEKLTPQEQVRYLAKHEPARTTEALRLLLNPHQSLG